jgi:hypothetical protein
MLDPSLGICDAHAIQQTPDMITRAFQTEKYSQVSTKYDPRDASDLVPLDFGLPGLLRTFGALPAAKPIQDRVDPHENVARGDQPGLHRSRAH